MTCNPRNVTSTNYEHGIITYTCLFTNNILHFDIDTPHKEEGVK